MVERKIVFCWRLTAAGLVFLGLLLAGCARSGTLPPDAEQALQDYWDSLPSDPGISNEIVRAWQGDTSAPELAPGTEVWCVDAEVSAPDPELDGETIRWIVVRTGENGDWTAAMLATMSAMWPYEACGE